MAQVWIRSKTALAICGPMITTSTVVLALLDEVDFPAIPVTERLLCVVGFPRKGQALCTSSVSLIFGKGWRRFPWRFAQDGLVL